MLCKKQCPADAFEKEVNGEKVLEIEGYEYRFPNKNLWRCSWGEHFDLDLDLEIPDVVEEKVILEKIAEHGTRSGEMGQCLKFCVPKEKREWDRDFSRTPLRKLTGAILERIAGLERRVAAVSANTVITRKRMAPRMPSFNMGTQIPESGHNVITS